MKAKEWSFLPSGSIRWYWYGKYLTEVFADHCKTTWEQQNSVFRAAELEMGVSRGEESVIQAFYPNPTAYTGIHFQGIHVLILLSHGWHPECDRKLKAEAQQGLLRGVIRGAKLLRGCRALPSAITKAKLSAGKAPAPATADPAGVIPLQFPPNSRGEASQETLCWLCWLRLSLWVVQNLILASGTDNEFILWLCAFFACHILASTKELFSERWRYSCPEEIALGKCIFFYSRQRKGKSSSINNSPTFSGPENNSNIDQLHLNPKCF